MSRNTPLTAPPINTHSTSRSSPLILGITKMVRPSTCGPLGFLVFWLALFATVASSASVGLFNHSESSSIAPSRTVTGYDVNGRDNMFIVPSGVSLVEHLINTIARFDAATKAKEEETLRLRTETAAYTEAIRALHTKEEEMNALARHRDREHIWVMSHQHDVWYNDPATTAHYQEIDTDSSHPWLGALWAQRKPIACGLVLLYIRYITLAIWALLQAGVSRRIAAREKECQESTLPASEETIVPSQHQERTATVALATTEIEQTQKQYQESTPSPSENAVVPSQQQERATTANTKNEPTQSKEAQPAPRRRTGFYGLVDSDEDDDEDEVPAAGKESPAVQADGPAPTKSRRSKYGIDLEEERDEVSGGEEKDESARVVQRVVPEHKARTPRVPTTTPRMRHQAALRALQITLPGPGSCQSRPCAPLRDPSPPSSSVSPSSSSATSVQEQLNDEHQQQDREQQQQPSSERQPDLSPPSSSDIPGCNDQTSAHEQPQQEQQVAAQQAQQQQPDPSPPSSSVIPSWNDSTSAQDQEMQEPQPEQQVAMQQAQQQPDVASPLSSSVIPSWTSWTSAHEQEMQEQELQQQLQQQLQLQQEQQFQQYQYEQWQLQQALQQQQLQHQMEAQHEQQTSYDIAESNVFPPGPPQAIYATPGWVRGVPAQAQEHGSGFPVGNSDWTHLASAQQAEQYADQLQVEQQPFFAPTYPESWNVPGPAFDYVQAPQTMSVASVFVAPEPVATEPAPDAEPEFDWSNVDPALLGLEPVDWSMVNPEFIHANLHVEQPFAPRPPQFSPVLTATPPAPASPETREETDVAVDLLLSLVNSVLPAATPQEIDRPHVNPPHVNRPQALISAEEEAMNLQAAPADTADMGAMRAYADNAQQEVARVIEEAQRQLDDTQTSESVNPASRQADFFADEPLAPPPPRSSFRLAIEDWSPVMTATEPTYPTLNEPFQQLPPFALAAQESAGEGSRAANQLLNVAQSRTSSQQVNLPEALFSTKERAMNVRSAPSDMADMGAMNASAERAQQEMAQLLEQARQEVQAGSQRQAQPPQPSTESVSTPPGSTQTIIGRRKVSTRNTFKPGRPAKSFRVSPSKDVSEGSEGARD